MVKYQEIRMRSIYTTESEIDIEKHKENPETEKN